MRDVIRRLGREPLIHFLVIGALVFAANAMRAPAGVPDDAVITVGAAEIEALQARWVRQRGRMPTATELEGLIEGRVREEVLYREALALGLERDDTIVRRRLAQKLEFLITDVAVPAVPDEAELEAFFASHGNRYAEPGRLTFSHVYFDLDRRGAAALAAAEATLAELSAAPAAAASEHGDRFMLGHDMVQASEAEVARQFGDAFASTLFTLEGDGWQGPVRSGYGLHLVRIEERIASRPVELEAVRAAVERDYLAERTRSANQQVYAELRDRYQVVVERPAGAPGAP